MGRGPRQDKNLQKARCDHKIKSVSNIRSVHKLMSDCCEDSECLSEDQSLRLFLVTDHHSLTGHQRPISPLTLPDFRSQEIKGVSHNWPHSRIHMESIDRSTMHTNETTSKEFSMEVVQEQINKNGLKKEMEAFMRGLLKKAEQKEDTGVKDPPTKK